MNRIRLNESQLRQIITETVGRILVEADRHREGYYAEYAKKRKAEGKPVDRHRKGYYKEYNKKHPERLERGYTKGGYRIQRNRYDDDIDTDVMDMMRDDDWGDFYPGDN